MTSCRCPRPRRPQRAGGRHERPLLQSLPPRAGYTSANQLDNSQEGWDAGLEINWAVTRAGTLDETAVMHKRQNLDINMLGIVWARTPSH